MKTKSVSLRAKQSNLLKDGFVALLLVMIPMLVSGCQTAKPKERPDSTAQTISALGTVTEGLTNQSVSQEDLKKLAVQVQKDPSTKAAVESINQALSVQQTGIKYCPVDGQRFDAKVQECPTHKVKLEIVE